MSTVRSAANVSRARKGLTPSSRVRTVVNDVPDNPSDTGWKKPTNVTGGDEYARGDIELATGTEQRPCFMCRSFEKDERKLTEHLIAKGLEAGPDGKFITPIAKDIPGRKSLKIAPRDYGWCRKDTMPVDMLATCDKWQQKRTSNDFR